MDFQLLIIAAAILALTVLSFLTWRSVAWQRPTGAGTEKLEIARLLERERSLVDDRKQLIAKAEELAAELNTLRGAHTKSREEVAAAQNEQQNLRDTISDRNQKIVGLEKMVEEFRGKAEASNRKVAELSANHAN